MAVARTSVSSAMQSSAAALTATFGAGAAAGNFGILVVETANQAITTPTGWTLAFQAATGTAGAAGATMLSVYIRSSITSGEVSGGISVSDSGDHQNCCLITYSGVYDYVVSAQFGGASSGTVSTDSISANAIGTDGIVLAIAGTDRDSATVSTNGSPTWNNVAGSNSFIVNGSSATGAGGGIIINEFDPSAPATGAVSTSWSITTSVWFSVLLALKPVPSPPLNLNPMLPLLAR